MALLKTLGRIAQVTGQNARISAYMARRGYAAEATEMSFTFATPSESFYSDAKVKQVSDDIECSTHFNPPQLAINNNEPVVVYIVCVISDCWFFFCCKKLRQNSIWL